MDRESDYATRSMHRASTAAQVCMVCAMLGFVALVVSVAALVFQPCEPSQITCEARSPWSIR
jgi:hypothetical protein